jgi:hypothetical protein
LEAYDLYLRARTLIYGRSMEGLREARRLIDGALLLDPDYAPALAFRRRSSVEAAACCASLSQPSKSRSSREVSMRLRAANSNPGSSSKARVRDVRSASLRPAQYRAEPYWLWAAGARGSRVSPCVHARIDSSWRPRMVRS